MAQSIRELRTALGIRSIPRRSPEAIQILILVVNMLLWGCFVLVLTQIS